MRRLRARTVLLAGNPSTARGCGALRMRRSREHYSGEVRRVYDEPHQQRTMNFDLSNGLAVLERTPATLHAMLAGLPAVWTSATEGPDTWSPYDIIGHLVHCERHDWMPRAQIILAQGAD